jgi:hypothetical protein
MPRLLDGLDLIGNIFAAKVEVRLEGRVRHMPLEKHMQQLARFLPPCKLRWLRQLFVGRSDQLPTVHRKGGRRKALLSMSHRDPKFSVHRQCPVVEEAGGFPACGSHGHCRFNARDIKLEKLADE